MNTAAANLAVAKSTTKVAIFGPNLSGGAQRLGNFHVHAADCADCKHYGYSRKFGGDNEPGKSDMVINVTSQWDVADFIYGPDAGDFDSTVSENMSDFHFAPCLRHLPEMTDANRAEEARRAGKVEVEVDETTALRAEVEALRAENALLKQIAALRAENDALKAAQKKAK